MNEKNSASSCMICGGETSPLFDEKIKVVYDVCTVCGFTYKQPRFHPTPEQEKILYDFHDNSMENAGYVTMLKTFLDHAVLPYIQSGDALDFGSGPGPVLYELTKRAGFHAEHYDPFYHPQADYENKTYDLITATEVFEHLSQPLKTMAKLSGLLKPGGYLAISTSLRPEDDQAFLTWWYRRDETHIGFFTPKALAHLIRDVPLKRVYTNHKNHFTFKKE